MNGFMNASVASQKTRTKMHRNAFERIEQSKWAKSCKCESNIEATQVIAK